MAKLTFVLEDGQEVVVPLKGSVTIGRGDDNDVVVDDERISRRHAELISHADGRLEVRDLDSITGTFVNDRSVQSQIIRQGDRLAFGPLTARLDLEDSAAEPDEKTGSDSPRTVSIRAEEKRLAELKAAIQEVEAAHSRLVISNEELSRQHAEKTAAMQQLADGNSAAQHEIESLAAQQEQEQSRLQQLRQDSAQEEARLDDLRRQLTEIEERSRSSKTLADTNLEHEQRLAQESLLRVQTGLATETRRLDEATTRRAEIEAQCQALASTAQQLATTREQLAATEQRREDAQAAIQQAQTQLAAQQSALQKASSAEATAQDRLAALAAREKELRIELETLGPGAETARAELAGIESRLIPLRDWKKSIDQRYARLSSLPKNSAEEAGLWHEIEAAHAALLDLPPAARIETPGLTRGDLARISTKAGIPMKSDRIRRVGS